MPTLSDLLDLWIVVDLWFIYGNNSLLKGNISGNAKCNVLNWCFNERLDQELQNVVGITDDMKKYEAIMHTQTHSAAVEK